MQKIRNESLFTWQHPLKVSGNRMTLFNNRCCDAHIKHLLSDNMWFTETHVDDASGYTPIDEPIDI